MTELKTISEKPLARAICRIPLKLPSLNDYVNAERTNRFKGAKMKRDTQDAIKVYMRATIHFENPVRLHFHWIEKTSRRDLDNVAFAKKFILDALVELGVLTDDSQKYVKGFTDTFEKGKENGVIVTIEEVEDDT